MRRARLIRAVRLAAVVAALMLLAGCSNPDAGGVPITDGGQAGRSVQSPGEPVAPPPARGSLPADVQPTARAALSRYARIYMDWSWKTLATVQRRLAAISVGQARITDRQAAAQARADRTLAAAHVVNHGVVLAIAPEQGHAGVWVVVSRQQTGGSGEYEGLPASYHVTLARLAREPDGWAVREWLPQS